MLRSKKWKNMFSPFFDEMKNNLLVIRARREIKQI